MNDLGLLTILSLRYKKVGKRITIVIVLANLFDVCNNLLAYFLAAITSS